MTVSIKMVGATDTGLIREMNEDSLCIIPKINLAVLADGMGGHKGGNVASRMAVTTLSEYLDEQSQVHEQIGGAIGENAMRDGFSMANSEVYASAHSLANCEGMGTTLVAGYFSEKEIQIGHIGDSRVYCFEHGELSQVTTDHTLATELISEMGAQDMPEYAHHVLRKALGIETSCEPDVFTVKPRAGQIYMLCSDGLSGVVSHSDLTTIIALRASRPEYCVETLIDSSLEQGAPDNVSVILVYIS